MTRATLLHVLARPTALGPAEVRELEQLAQAFPYCQTAHLLLAKAAHDQGTMLAGQRLRRAATYAADRSLLRRLIEEVAPAVAAELPAELAPAPVAEEVIAPTQAPEAVPTTPSSPTIAPVAVENDTIAVVGSSVSPEPLAPTEIETTPAVETTPAPAMEPLVELSGPKPEPAIPAPVEPEVAQLEAAEAAVVEPEIAVVEPEAAALKAAPAPAEPAAAMAPIPLVEAEILPVLVDQEGVDIPTVAPAFDSPAEIIPEVEPDLPPQAPAIRPPVEVGEARFEFGLAEPPAPAVPTYELPGLVDEWAASAVTRTLGRPEPISALRAHKSTKSEPPVFTPLAFTGDATVGYAFGESSRLGFSMQLLNLLTDQAETAEGTWASATSARLPAAPLPPVGAFFEPDPLLLDYWASHRPSPQLQPSSFDLINNFLRRQPRLTRPAMLPPTPAAQADLSVRSTRAEPDIASESLARILVRQGKTARAIEIYEKLMVKQPEKMAYFTAQIQQLLPPA